MKPVRLPPLSSLRRGLLPALWLALAVVLALGLLQLDTALLWQYLRRASVPSMVLAALCNGTTLVWHTLLWGVLLPAGRKVSFSRLLDVRAATAMASTSFHVLGGQAVGSALLARQDRMGLTAALSILAQDHVSASLSKVALMAIVLAVASVPGWLVHGAAILAAGALAILLVALALAHRPPAGGSGALGRALASVGRWAALLGALRHGRQLALAVGLSCLVRAAEVGGLALAQRATGLHLPWWSPLLAQAAVQVAHLVPISPANLGIYEAAVALTYTSLGVPPELALGTALLGHMAYLASQVSLGWAWLNVRAWRTMRRRTAA